ncbi:MAG: S8 family peptidase [Bacteriovoracia bacterium]
MFKKWVPVALQVAVVGFSFVLTLALESKTLASISHIQGQLRNWGLVNSLTNSHIHALDAWKIEEGSKDVVVAVIDTGIDPNHPDLKHNLWKGENGMYGWDFVTNTPNPKDEHGHGTHVAGILGAALNAKAGISGVAHHVSIMPVRYYSDRNSGYENLQNSIKALNWAIDHGAKVINYSGGGPEFSQEEFDALKRAKDKGIILVAAAGNEHENTDLPKNYYYPCAYKRLDNILCVAAINIRNQLLPSSNWGKTSVDVAAPGENILSTAPGGRYTYLSGTSQATAFVTGMVALMLSKKKNLTPTEIRQVIRSTVDRIPALKDRVMSGGKVNAANALAALDVKPALKASLKIDTNLVKGVKEKAQANEPSKKKKTKTRKAAAKTTKNR